MVMNQAIISYTFTLWQDSHGKQQTRCVRSLLQCTAASRTDLQEKERGKAYYLLGIQQKKANRLSEYHSAMENARKISEKHNPELLFYIADFYEQDGGYNHETAVLLYKKFISKSKDCDQSLINEAQNRIKRLSKHKK